MIAGLRRLAWAATLLGAAILIDDAEVLANAATYVGSNSGRNVYPIANKQVFMRREVVEMKAGSKPGDQVQVSAEFWFVNGGSPAAFRMGFPIESSRVRRKVLGELPSDFRLTIDGRTETWSREIVTETGSTELDSETRTHPVYLWPIKFAPGQERHIKVEYGLWWGGPGRDALYDSSIAYVLRTGALWNGPIGESSVSLVFPDTIPLVALSPRPEGFCYDGRRVSWHFRNFVPAEDVHIGYSPELAEKFRGRFTTPWCDSINGYHLDHELADMGLSGREWGSVWPTTNPRRIPAWVGVLDEVAKDAAFGRILILSHHGGYRGSGVVGDWLALQPWYHSNPFFNMNTLNSVERLNLACFESWECAFLHLRESPALGDTVRALITRYW